MQFINLCPHDIKLNDGTVYKHVEVPARISNSFTEFDNNGVCSVSFGEPENLPEPQEGVMYIVSQLMLSACPDRKDLVAPATGHPQCIREDGRIISVPGFVH